MKHLTIVAMATLILSACGGEKKDASTPNDTNKTAVIAEIPSDVKTLLDKHTCLTCHKVEEKLVGPALKDVAQKGYSAEEMANLMFNPNAEHWPGYPAMPVINGLTQEDALAIAKWVNTLK